MKYGFHLVMVLLFAVLAAIKLVGGVAMSWWLVAAPLLLLGGLMAVAFVFAIALATKAYHQIDDLRDDFERKYHG